MNPKWLKQNAVMLAAGAIWLVAMALIVWLHFRTSGHTDEITQQLDEQQGRLQSILNTKPFPSQENVEIIRRSREQLEEQYNRLHQAVCIGSLQIEPTERALDFSSQLARRKRLMRQRSTQANVKLPENFSFGFSRYDSGPPTTEDKAVLALLAKQLAVVEKLVDTLLQSRIDEIHYIKRAEVDPGGTNNDALSVPVENDPKAQYHILPFEMEFAGTAQSLREFLNRLAVLDCFFTVRTLRVTTEGVTSEVDETGAPRRVTGPASDRARVVATCRIDLVEFPTEPAAAPAAAPATEPSRGAEG